MPELPGVSVSLYDGYYAISTVQSKYTDRIVLLARTNATGSTAGHHYTPIRYSNLADVASTHGASSECYEAFYHALQAGATDLWLCPLPPTPTGNTNRVAQLVSGYNNLDGIEPTLIVPFGRAAYIAVDASGAITRTVYSSTGDEHGARADVSTYLADLASACSTISTTNRQCMGVIGVHPPAAIDAASLTAYTIGSTGTVDTPKGTLANALPTGIADSLARYVSVFVGEVETSGQVPWGWRPGSATTYWRSNGAVNYAGIIATLQPHDPPTNKIMRSVSYVPWRWSNNQLKSFVSMRVVAPRLGIIENVVRVCDSPTYASSISDFRRLSTMRIVGEAVEMMRSIGQKFVGKNMSLWNQNSFKTSITTALEQMKQHQAINRYSFSVEFVPIENAADVTIVIEPAWELRLIRTTISVTF